MSTLLQTELKQTKPFESPMHEAWLSIDRTASVLAHGLEQALKPFGITPTQYNVLRILRGAGPDGLCRNEVRDRLVSVVPDTTRLLDRAEQLGLLDRVRSTEDRRRVMNRITKKGTALLKKTDRVVMQQIDSRLAHLSSPELRTLVKLLDKTRRGTSA